MQMRTLREGYAGKPDIASLPVLYYWQSIDQDEDFEDWSLEELQERVDVVMDFDQLCDDIVAEAAYMAEKYDVEEETYYVENTRKVLAECKSA